MTNRDVATEMAQKAEDLEAAALLRALRTNGWSVAVHNDYYVNTIPEPRGFRTFWLLTHREGFYVKGEGASDLLALRQCGAGVAALPLPPGARPLSFTSPRGGGRIVL